jgi:FtsH-binding integral membrane protein
MSSYSMQYPLVYQASESARAAFIRRTYLHLAAAILAFVGLEVLIFGLTSQMQLQDTMMRFVARPMSALLIFGGFIAVSYLAQWWATQGGSRALQYAGLGLYVVAEALIFVPLLFMALYYVNDKTIIPTAAVLTLTMFGGLTAAAFVTQKDFSFLGPILSIAGFLILGVIICSFFISGLTLGLWFSVLMIGIASASILYDTSNVIHRYRTDQHVAAALGLFASIALLFYYILRLLIQLQSGGRD